MSKYSELAGLGYTTHESGASKTTTPPAPEPVVEAPPVYENPLDSMPVASEAPEAPESIEISIDDLQWMSKIKLEEIGRTLGVELDRRLSQPKLVKQLKEVIEQQQD